MRFEDRGIRRMIQKQLKRREKEIMIGFLILIGVYFFVMGVVLVAGIYGNRIYEVFMVGTLFAMGAGFSLQVFVSSFCFLREFNMAISMGQTRKRFVWCYELISVLEFLAITVLGRVFWAFEEQVYHWVIPKAHILFRAEVIFGWKQIIMIVLGAVAVQMLLQALVLRYGIKVYWGVWFIWMLVAYVPRMLHRDSIIARKGIAFMEWVVRMSVEFGENFWILAGLGVYGGLIGIAWMFLRRQQVTM